MIQKKNTLIKDAIFISSKTYALNLYDGTELIKFKGINIKDVSFDELKYQFFNNSDGVTLKTSQFSKKNLSLEHSITSKTVNLQNYNKRIFINGKTDTIPLINN